MDSERPELNVVVDYPIAVLTLSKHIAAAQAWVDFVTSPSALLTTSVFPKAGASGLSAAAAVPSANAVNASAAIVFRMSHSP